MCTYNISPYIGIYIERGKEKEVWKSKNILDAYFPDATSSHVFLLSSIAFLKGTGKNVFSNNMHRICQ